MFIKYWGEIIISKCIPCTINKSKINYNRVYLNYITSRIIKSLMFYL